jgi:riboflavin synthase
MFSGIIERTAKLSRIIRKPQASDTESAPALGQIVFTLQTGFPDLVLGESIAINGVCLTVTRFDSRGEADFYLSPETLDRTALGSLTEGDRVNLERALRIDARLSGHLVQGHVDGVGTLMSIRSAGDSHHLQVHLPKPLGRWCIEKGSITLDGISLTLNAVRDTGDGTLVDLMIIPHTWEHTTLSDRESGDRMNIEVDVIAKYVERLTAWKN